jgi:hypothetical protein
MPNPDLVTSVQELRMRPSALCLSLCLTFALTAQAAEGIREERVQFKPGTSHTTLKGHLRGDGDVDYLLGAKAGQHMTVELHTDNPQNYFNILPPGSDDAAIFVGSSSGNRFDGTLPDSGDYRVRVYLMRAAARRDESAHYRVDIHIGSAHVAKPTEPVGDFADGLSGGPDFWEVHGVPTGDTLNLRAGPSTHERVVGEIGNGSILRNLGCRMSGEQRWCQVARREDPGPRGWVAGRYLRESSYQP